MPKGIPKNGDINKGWVKKGQFGEAVPNWKGSAVSYRGLHKWVRTHKPSSGKCESCNQTKKLDLANVSGEYKRDLSDWQYLCRKCHMASDGRYDALIKRNSDCNPSQFRWK